MLRRSLCYSEPSGARTHKLNPNPAVFKSSPAREVCRVVRGGDGATPWTALHHEGTANGLYAVLLLLLERAGEIACRHYAARSQGHALSALGEIEIQPVRRTADKHARSAMRVVAPPL